MELNVIAYARNRFVDKFGIPRQSRADSQIETRIIFTPSYRQREALRGIEGFSHLWLIWGFSRLKSDWSPTVRPPRLGGNTRVGVFASRSPYRPNPLGLTSVRLVRVEDGGKDGLVLVVSGADLMDGTPIYDIKPYLSFSDCHADAANGFAEPTKDYRLEVTGLGISIESVEPGLSEADRRELQLEMEEILSQDPRPAYQDDQERVYALAYGDYTIRFRVQEEGSKTVCHVVEILKRKE